MIYLKKRIYLTYTTREQPSWTEDIKHTEYAVRLYYTLYIIIYLPMLHSEWISKEFYDDMVSEEQRFDRKQFARKQKADKKATKVIDQQIYMFASVFDLLNPQTSRC